MVTRYTSSHLPLGIVRMESEEADTVKLRWKEPGQLLLCSDGVIEATSDEGDVFDYEGVEKAALSASPSQRLTALQRALSHHLAGMAGHDDISMLLISLPV